jgi:integrase
MKRGQGEGTIHHRRDGLWEAQISLGYVGGRRRRRSFYGRTKTEAREKMQAALREVQGGARLPAGRVTVGTFLTEWLEGARQSVRPSTHSSYAHWLTRHVIPELGRVRLEKLGPQDVQRLMARKRAQGLSPQSVQHIRAVLRRALQQAVKWRIVTHNAAALADPPRVPRRPLVQVSPEAARQILAAVEGTRLEAVVTLTLFTGLRQGEALGLRWPDLDLDACTLRVGMALQRLRRGPGSPCPLVLVEPKTSRSRRSVDFPRAVAEVMRRHRAAQAEERLRAGMLWEEPIPGLVFTTVLGRPLDGPTVTKAFQDLLMRAGLPRLTYHELRHGCATLLLASGTDIAVVRDILGHSTIALTADTYAAVLPSLQRAAAERLAAFIGVSGSPAQ